jgi:transglutaminase-like putative cysteine protease
MTMKPILRIIVCALFFLTAGSAWAQFKDDVTPGGATLGETKTMKWQAGLTADAAGPCKAIHGYIPVPTDWPEQQVSIVKEEISPGVNVSYRMIGGGVKVMDIRAGYLTQGRDLKAVVTFEVRRRKILAPENTDDFVMPNLKKLPIGMQAYLHPSPLIESRDPKIRKQAKELVGQEDKAWAKVKAIYDWVRGHVKYQNGPLKGALAALKDRTGDCEEIASLFIAMCRAADIPARTVWIPGQTEKMDHCYMEFYLEDKKGTGHWFPCQSAGAEEFGQISETRPILQKGDNFTPLQGEKKPQRYLAERITVQMQNQGDFHPRWVRKLVP